MQASSLSEAGQGHGARRACGADAGAAEARRTIACSWFAASRQQPTLALGWLQPPQLLDLYIDVSEGKYNQFMITIDKVDGGRVMQLRRVARDSNRELRLALNSSAFGPGDYLFKFDGYNWRGQTGRGRAGMRDQACE